MKRTIHRWFLVLILSALLSGVCISADGRQPGSVPRIGMLNPASLSNFSARREAFSGDGNPDRMAEQAAELVRQKVNIIVTAGSQATRPAKEATNTIPIVMAQDNDPVGSGFVDSLAKPGGNITGLANLTTELSGKQLETLAAIYVDKILKGAKPGNLPVEQPVKFDLMFNLRAAKRIGVIIPDKLLARADRVIK